MESKPTQKDSHAKKETSGRVSRTKRLVIYIVVAATCAAGLAITLVLFVKPSEPERLMERIEVEKEQGDFEAAIGTIEKLITDFPSSREAAKAMDIYPGVLLEKLRREVEKSDYFTLQSALGTMDLLLDNFPDSKEAEEAAELGLTITEKLLDFYLAIMQSDLPREIEEALDNIQYVFTKEDVPPQLEGVQVISAFPRNGDTDACQIYFLLRNINPVSDDLECLILHEWGHVIDRRCLDDKERSEYRSMRGIPLDLEWKVYETSEASFDASSYINSPAEDFAEVFTSVVGKKQWRYQTTFGEVKDDSAIFDWLISACDR